MVSAKRYPKNYGDKEIYLVMLKSELKNKR